MPVSLARWQRKSSCQGPPPVAGGAVVCGDHSVPWAVGCGHVRTQPQAALGTVAAADFAPALRVRSLGVREVREEETWLSSEAPKECAHPQAAEGCLEDDMVAGAFGVPPPPRPKPAPG